MPLPLPAPGSVVVIRQRRWRVERVSRGAHVVRLDVANRERRLTFLSPFDRPASVAGRERIRRARPAQARARLAHLLATAVRHREPGAMIAARADILPHQLEPALAMLAGRRRVLLADEVGLGKTIQAGLVIAEVLRREAGARVLLLIPASLRDQWEHELRRFGIDARRADRPALEARAAERAFGHNPWDRAGVVMASPDFVKQEHVLESLPVRPWDLLVIDEAHDACGESSRHEACHELARRSRRVLLLTATPHSGDPARFARLKRLGGLPGLSEPLTILRRTRAGLGLASARRVRWHRVRPSAAEARLLAALLEFERRVLRTTEARVHDNASLLLSVFRKRLLSTPSALRRSLERRRQWLSSAGGWPDSDWVQPALDFADAEDDVSADEVRGLTGATGLPPGQERSWLRRLSELAGVAEQEDTKARRVVNLLARTTEPIVVFTEFRDSLSVLDRRLRGVRSTAILHGGLSEPERRQALDRFASGAASVLLATDVASQGLNLQDRARWVLSLELPWNPVKLEQRAGRVDRIGQRRPVHITLLVTDHSAEHGLLSRLAHRVLVARRAVGEDTLRAGLPDEAGVRDSLLSGAPADLAAVEPGPPICRHWARPARWMATRLCRWRQLRTRWRAPHDTPSTTFRSQWRPGQAADRRMRSRLLVLGVPIVDEHGALIEERVACVRVAEDPHGDEPAEAIERARRLVARLAGPRIARLRRLARAESERAARVESAIARRLANHLDPGEVQSGLFDRRSDRLAEAADADAFDVRAMARERLALLERRAAVDAGRPVLRAILGEQP